MIGEKTTNMGEDSVERFISDVEQAKTLKINGKQ